MESQIFQSKDVFCGVTETGWVAVGSIVSTVSIIVLSILNWLALRAAKRSAKATEIQASAALKQTQAAMETLDSLRLQVHQQELLQKQTAIEVLEETARRAVNWKAKLHVDYSGEVRLFPSQWVGVMLFSSQQTEGVRQAIRKFEGVTAETEALLVEYMHQHIDGRRFVDNKANKLLIELEIVSTDAKVIAETIRGI